MQVIKASVNLPNTCSHNLAVNITDGENNNEIIQKDGITYNSRNYYRDGKNIFGCVCNVKPCVRKCCGPNEIVSDGCTISNHSFSFEVFNGTELALNSNDFYVIHNLECEYGHIRLHPDFEDPEWPDNFYLQLNGSLYAPLVDEKKPIYTLEEYCLDTFIEEGETIFQAVICLENVQEIPKTVYKIIGKICCCCNNACPLENLIYYPD